MKHVSLGKLFIPAVALCFANAAAPAQGNDAKPAPAAAPSVNAPDRAQFVGAKKCSECHAAQFDGWQGTAHTKIIRPPVAGGTNATVLADFGVPSEHRHFELKDVKWVIGSRWKQRFIGEVDGSDVVFPAQWSVRDKKWMPYTAKTDWWWKDHQDWKTRSNFQLCAGCHSTGLDVKTETWAELNITCENCHGPGREHSATPKAGNIVNPARLSTARSMDICLTCHGPGKDHGPREKSVIEHTHHTALSTGSRCIECHMAKTGSNAVPGEARNHTFDFISPTDTIRNGDPNSCNARHADRTPQWALDAVMKWWPKKK